MQTKIQYRDCTNILQPIILFVSLWLWAALYLSSGLEIATQWLLVRLKIEPWWLQYFMMVTNGWVTLTTDKVTSWCLNENVNFKPWGGVYMLQVNTNKTVLSWFSTYNCRLNKFSLKSNLTYNMYTLQWFKLSPSRKQAFHFKSSVKWAMREHEQVTKPQGALMCDFSQYPRNGQLAKRQNKP